ncbi:carcinoembryonic antigen-related cell adhesion molecule 2-like [Phodopus roborovskii]|uniref:carcinoembryonic antigen-related cell adhesion molecule 2-like n=1 Tax=Phodopus roborovskii TaxID=109678 RepID=UPI0021E4D086|nr:carcinoembryonic antigen-related cell adhesion molecule 2-like [Phodopus roborovskii]
MVTHLSNVKVTSLLDTVWEGLSSNKLTCEPKINNTIYLWRINGRNITEDGKRKLSDDNRILTLLNIVRNDTGPYECEVHNPVTISRSFPFYLEISYGPDDPIISPSNTHFQSRTNLSLSCEADSIPPARYSWFVNGVLQASSQELFIPDITTNNSGSYTCFAHNSVTGLNRTTVKIITVLESGAHRQDEAVPEQQHPQHKHFLEGGFWGI